jgi:preprotein translocase subunit SecG
MSGIEIVAGSFLILCCIVIVIIVSLQGSKGGGLSSAIMGGEGGSARGRAKDSDAKLSNLTKWLAVVFFVVTVVVNIVALTSGGASV